MSSDPKHKHPLLILLMCKVYAQKGNPRFHIYILLKQNFRISLGRKYILHIFSKNIELTLWKYLSRLVVSRACGFNIPQIGCDSTHSGIKINSSSVTLEAAKKVFL